MKARRLVGMAAAALLAGVLSLPAATGSETKVRLAEGTKIVFTLNDALSTKSSRAGDDFSGVVSRSVRIGNDIVIPEGSVVHGKVTRVVRPGRAKGRAELNLRFEAVELPDGTELPIAASLTELDEDEKETVTDEGGVKGEGSKKRDAAAIGAGAGIGAAIGAITGGGQGAIKGGAIGAGAGTGVVLVTRGKDINIKRGTELAIQLDRALTVPVQ